MAALKYILSKTVAWDVLLHNPASGVKLQKKNNRRLRCLTPEECKILLDACPSPTLNPVIELGIDTGMRKNELLWLEWNHVNLREEFLEILDQKNGEYDKIPLNA